MAQPGLASSGFGIRSYDQMMLTTLGNPNKALSCGMVNNVGPGAVSHAPAVRCHAAQPRGVAFG
jgi:hypothetical protein